HQGGLLGGDLLGQLAVGLGQLDAAGDLGVDGGFEVGGELLLLGLGLAHGVGPLGLLGLLRLGPLLGLGGLGPLVVEVAGGAFEAVGDVGVVERAELDVELAVGGGGEVLGVEHPQRVLRRR